MKVIVDGLATEYSDEGSGPALLMLHGWGDTLHSFDALVERLPGYRIVRLDMPGFGGTEFPKVTWGVGDYARFAAAFCQKIDVQPAAILGHSFGGRIILRGFSDGTFAAEKAVLIGSAGVADRPTMRNTLFMRGAKIVKVLLRPIRSAWYEKFRRALYAVLKSDYFSAGELGETFVRVINEDLSAHAKRISVPVLLIWGTDDIITPVSEGRKLERLIPNSTFQILHGAGHFVHQQKPDEVADRIKQFLV